MSRRSILVPETLNGRLFLALAGLAAVMVIQAILGASPALALSETPDNTYMTDGKVYATALSRDGKVLYIGGEFTRVQQKSGSSFAVKNVAAINVKTGAAIRTWRPEVTGHDAVVRSLAVENGKVFIGGNFTAVEGKPRKNLAAVGAYTKAVVLSPFAPQVGGDTSYVFALEAGDRKLYAGGGFSKVNGAPRKNLAAFSLETGALDRHWKPKATKAPTCTDPKCSHKVRVLELGPGGKSIFVGGSFSHVSGTNGRGGPRQSVARVYTATGNLHPWKIPSGTIEAPQTAWDLTATRTRLYGGFGTRRNFLAAFRLDKGNSGVRAWRFATVGNVQSVALTRDHSRLFFGGHFGINEFSQRVCNGKRLRGLASVNPATGKIYCGWIPSLDQNRRPSYEGAWALTTTPSYLWVGGGFIGVSDSIKPRPAGNGVTEVPQTSLARFTL
ncbi:MAG TPA: hypothetical protein VI055_12060 [Rubrobacter sp.]